MHRFAESAFSKVHSSQIHTECAVFRFLDGLAVNAVIGIELEFLSSLNSNVSKDRFLTLLERVAVYVVTANI